MSGYSELSFAELRKLCKDRGLQSHPGTKEELLLRLKAQDESVASVSANKEDAPDENSIIIPTEEDVSNFAGATLAQKNRLDELRSNIRNIFAKAKTTIENKWEELNIDKRITFSFSIDEHEQTIHFMGGTRGLICTTLKQPDKAILKQALHYTTLTDTGKQGGLKGDLS